MNESLYYCIYFDVAENQGIRIIRNETDDLNTSGTSPTIVFEASEEGWWMYQNGSFQNYYTVKIWVLSRIYPSHHMLLDDVQSRHIHQLYVSQAMEYFSIEIAVLPTHTVVVYILRKKLTSHLNKRIHSQCPP